MGREKIILDLEHAEATLELRHLHDWAVPLRRAALYLRNMDQGYQVSIGDMNGDEPDGAA
jgi:hypothetical protein